MKITTQSRVKMTNLCQIKTTKTNAITKMSGIHWSTIRYVHKQLMDQALDEHEMELKRSSYKPRFLAIDEFAIQKGHTYATTVMDLETGYVLCSYSF